MTARAGGFFDTAAVVWGEPQGGVTRLDGHVRLDEHGRLTQASLNTSCFSK